MARPTYSDFKELGSGLELSGSAALQKLYDELGKLETLKGSDYVPGIGKKLLVQMYFPDRTGRGDDNIFIGEIKVKKNPDRRTERLDANIIIQNCLSRHDTRQPPVFFSTEDYEKAKKNEELRYSYEIARVLTREPRPLYFVHSKLQK